MGESSLLIIDEARSVHRLGIGMTGQGYLVATSDSFVDVLKLFSMRGVPRYIFTSTELPGYVAFIRMMKKQKFRDVYTLVPLVPPAQANGGIALEIVKPCTPEKIRDILRRLETQEKESGTNHETT